MKQGSKEMVFILDNSGSMSGLEADTIGGFNSLIEKQRKIEGEALVSTILFNSRNETLHDRVSLTNIKPMDDKQYSVGGGTALLDALGKTIKHIESIHKYIREEDVPEHTVFVITTDGMENASCEYSIEMIKAMVESKRENGWEFVFLGANIDAIETARSYGMPFEDAANYCACKDDVVTLYDAVSERLEISRKGIKNKNRDWAKKLNKEIK